MEKSFTQRMDWLHTWFGLVLGWLAFALFLTGTISVFWMEISHWAQPELHGAKMLSTPATVQYSLDYLRKVAPDSKRWNVYMPDFERHPLLVLSWLDENDAQQFVRLVPDGSGREVTTVTNGGRFFVDFHWTFNRVVPDLQGRTFGWAYMLSGFVGMAFLIGSITGLVIHKKIFRNFFTFRRRREGGADTLARRAQRAWRPRMAVPVHDRAERPGLLLLSLYSDRHADGRALSGAAPCGGRRQRRGARDVMGSHQQRRPVERRRRADRSQVTPRPTCRSPDLFAQAQEQMGPLSGFAVSNPNRDNAIVRFGGPRARPDVITFTVREHDLRWGHRPRHQSPGEQAVDAVQTITNIFAGIHFAFYGGTAMRILYFLCGAAGTIMIATGLVMFTTKRRAKAHSAAAGRFYAFVDRMNVAAVGGALFACASYFWALRLLPQSLSDPSGGFFDGVYASIRARAARSGGALRFRAVYVLAGLGCRHGACVRASAAQSLDRAIRRDRGALHRASRDRLSGAQLRYRLDDHGGRLEDGGRRS